MKHTPHGEDVSDLAVGIAAEHIVCADLLLLGFNAFMSDQVCAYDVAVDVGGRLTRVQVKATRAPKSVPKRPGQYPVYIWHIRRAGKGGERMYRAGDFDLLALVALDTMRIAYMPPSQHKKTIHIRQDNPRRPASRQRGRVFSDFPFSKAMKEVLSFV